MRDNEEDQASPKEMSITSLENEPPTSHSQKYEEIRDADAVVESVDSPMSGLENHAEARRASSSERLSSRLSKRESPDAEEVEVKQSKALLPRLRAMNFKQWVEAILIYVVTPLYILVVCVGASRSRDATDTDFSNSTLIGCPDLETLEPLSDGWALALSLIPFLLVINGILGLNWSSHFVAPWTLVITVLIGLTFFDGRGWLETEDYVTTCGIVILTILERILWTLFDYAFAVFAAFLFLEVVERWGVVRSMQEEFEILADSPVRKLLLVNFCFAILIAVVAPGGSNFLIAGSILIRMNINNEPTEEGRLESGRRIAAICLFGNGLTSAFNLVGVCIIAIAEDIVEVARDTGTNQPCEALDVACATKQIGFQFSLQFMIFCIVSPLIMVLLFTKSFNADVKKNLVLLLSCGTIYGLAQLATARFLGPELPCLTAAGAALVFYMAYLFLPDAIRKLKSPDEEDDTHWTFRDQIVKHSYVLPFVLLMGLLFLVRAVPGLEDILQGGDNSVMQRILNPTILEIKATCESWTRQFPWLSSSGMLVVWSSLLTPLIVPFRSTELDREKKHKDHVKDVDHYNFWRRYRKIVNASVTEAIRESKHILVSIAAYAALAKIMAGFQMTQTIASAFVGALQDIPAVYTLVAPFIGFLGAGLTGSTTTSNFLFGRLQVQTAIDLGLVTPTSGSVWAVAGVQILGSSAGEIISPMNAVFSAVLLKSAVPESDIIKQVLKVFLLWMAMCMVVSFIALYLMQDFY